MNKYQENKRRLMELIHEMQVFTLEALMRRFYKEVRGCRLINGNQTIRSFLEDLREHRILRKTGMIWSVVSS